MDILHKIINYFKCFFNKNFLKKTIIKILPILVNSNLNKISDTLMRLYNHPFEKEKQKIEFLLINNYFIGNIELPPSTISMEMNNIFRKCIGYKTPKEFYKSYSKCCTLN